jgi:response regulator RpfG family c-di-GMP phosphodiesterase
MLRNDFDLLIVDDDPEILSLLTDTFADCGYRTQSANNISAARGLLARYAFRVILSDHNLPDGNGVDFLAEMTGLGLSTVPILMTGLLDANVAIQAINRGKVYKFVTKPLDLMLLTQTVRRALDHHAATQERRMVAFEMLASNERLRRESSLQKRTLQEAAQRIREGEVTVEQQQSHIHSLHSQVHRAYLQTVTSLSAAIEAKDPYTRGHSERVFYYCSLMADALGLPPSSRTELRFASVLHDVGKIGIPDSILTKPGTLTADEFDVISTHPLLTDDILQHLPFLASVRRIISEHHERFDGAGYPNRLKGEQISTEGRILGVADAYDAMRSDRPYRQALSQQYAMSELSKGSGSQFCPLCVGSLLLSLRIKGEYDLQRAVEWKDDRWVADYCQSHFASTGASA